VREAAIQPLGPGQVFDAADAPVRVPGSKSITNRALMVAALADGVTRLDNALFSDDSKWMAQCLRDMGFGVIEAPASRSITVQGQGGRLPADAPAATGRAPLFVGNAGTAARFLPCLAALGNAGRYRFEGDPRMAERPMRELLGLLGPQGAELSGDRYPFSLAPHGLKGGELRIDLTKSTQFASGLLMAAPHAQADLQLIAEGDRTQLPYVDMTLAVMEQFGVLGKAEGARYTVAAGQRYKAQPSYSVEPDVSAAAYPFAWAALCGGRVKVLGTSNSSIQGDIRFLKVLQHMGVRFYQDEDGLMAERHPHEPLKGGMTVDMNAFSDQALTLACLAPFASGPIKVVNVPHIRHQECDRIHAAVVNLRVLGIQVDEAPDGFTVHPGTPKGARVQAFGDHRVAMAFSLIGLKVPGVVIDDADCVSKTFADYWDVLAAARPQGGGHGA
jgi:3-phosphoshikimate 1-carboxyvinyltransferase